MSLLNSVRPIGTDAGWMSGLAEKALLDHLRNELSPQCGVRRRLWRTPASIQQREHACVEALTDGLSFRAQRLDRIDGKRPSRGYQGRNPRDGEKKCRNSQNDHRIAGPILDPLRNHLI